MIFNSTRLPGGEKDEYLQKKNFTRGYLYFTQKKKKKVHSMLKYATYFSPFQRTTFFLLVRSLHAKKGKSVSQKNKRKWERGTTIFIVWPLPLLSSRRYLYYFFSRAIKNVKSFFFCFTRSIFYMRIGNADDMTLYRKDINM